MKLPSFRRVIETDYPKESQELIRQLSASINYGFEPLYELLNGKLSFVDNTASLLTSINVEVNASGVPKVKTTIKKTGTDKFAGFVVLRAENLTNSSVYPTGSPLIAYTETVNSITINHISGLPANNLFQLTLFGIR